MDKTKEYALDKSRAENNYSAELDNDFAIKDETNLLKQVEQFSQQIFSINNKSELLSLIKTSFLQVFHQPLCLVYSYDKASQTLNLLNHENVNNVSQKIPFDSNLVLGKESFLLSTLPTIKESLSSINLEDALVAPLMEMSGAFNGFIISGFGKEDVKVTCKDRKLSLSSYSTMTNLASLCLNNLKNNELIEEERQVINEQLKRSNEDLEQFAYIISHDLKAPLRNIKSFAQLLQKMYRDKLDGDGMTFLDFITGGVSKFDNLINDLLQYSRVSRRAMPFEEIDLNEIIEEVTVGTYMMASKDDVEIKSQKLPKISGNPHRIEQLIQNLVDNAVKFKQPGVKAKIAIKVKTDKETIQLSVIDNGIGIEKQYSERIFQLFQKLHADSEYSGTGLGLSICKKIVERHQGRIWMESDGLNKGTSFHIVLPKNL